MYTDYIESIEGMQVLDSRGNPTLQVRVTLETDVKGDDCNVSKGISFLS